ncbi:MAG: rRNA pseudouridine synthase [Clostridiales bacterium]|jgi:16S rRNA pseudouridine516 synthase|nr:rRNA pseudouridine synthase [Clostridiales bacterium]
MSGERGPAGEKADRLDKILSNMGIGTRAEVKRLIRAGDVTCGGAVVKDPETKFAPNQTVICVAGRTLRYQEHIYLMMNKPEGYVSATHDAVKRTVSELLPERCRVFEPFPVGRLDIDTTGLLLLTDDGELAHRLLSPKHHVEKEYEAELDRMPDENVVEAFAQGLRLEGFLCKPARLLLPGAPDTPKIPGDMSALSGDVSGIPTSPGDASALSGGIPAIPGGVPDVSGDVSALSGSTAPPFVVRVILTEGKFHQIKRMFARFDIRVLRLRRIRMHSLLLDPALAPGESRELSPAELTALSAAR